MVWMRIDKRKTQNMSRKVTGYCVFNSRDQQPGSSLVEPLARGVFESEDHHSEKKLEP